MYCKQKLNNHMKSYQGYLNGVIGEQIALMNSKLFIYWR